MKDDQAYIEHIQDCIKKVKAYTDDLDEDSFIENEMVQDAVIRNFEIIGEATKMISDNLKQSYYEIPWKEIAGMRDKLIHDYLGVDVYVIWETIKNDIPILEKFLDKIIKNNI